jgi:tRNA(His) guanylyltransferase
VLSKSAAEKQRKLKRKCGITIEHVDIIQDKYWETRPWIISGSGGRLKQEPQMPIPEALPDINRP